MKDTLAVDIDGCLNYYPDPLKMWAEMLFSLDEVESRQAVKKENDFDLLKRTYRHSFILSHFLPREGAVEVLQKIKKSGYFITLLTSRNPDKNPKIREITLGWLAKHEIPFDSLVFTRDKGGYVKENERRIAMVVEDDPEFLGAFKKLKTEIVVFKNDLNSGVKSHNFHTASSWREIGELFETAVRA